MGPGGPQAEEKASAAADVTQEAQHWNLLTVVSLAAWAEDAISKLGPKSFQVMLDLSRLVDLVTPETRDVLVNISELSEASDQEERPINIAECLVVIRQLDAILYGGQERAAG